MRQLLWCSTDEFLYSLFVALVLVLVSCCFLELVDLPPRVFSWLHPHECFRGSVVQLIFLLLAAVSGRASSYIGGKTAIVIVSRLLLHFPPKLTFKYPIIYDDTKYNHVVNLTIMLEFLFGWRKASKCKKLLRHLQCRLKLLTCRRSSIVNHLRDDIALLLNKGLFHVAFARVGQLYKDMGLVAAYDLLDHFCEFILIHFKYICRNRSCSSNNVNEAISTLIFAAAWCGDLPELQVIQKLFRERYGRRLSTAAIELHPGSHVNNEMREKLCRRFASDDIKIKLINEIAKDYGIRIENMYSNILIKEFEIQDKSIFLFDSAILPIEYRGVISRSSKHVRPSLLSDSSIRLGNTRTETLNCKHVHPKLPDYDDLVAKFMTLKKEHQQNKC